MTDYFIRIIFFKYNIPLELLNIVSPYLDNYSYKKQIKDKEYLTNGFWFKRITCRNVYEIKKHHLNYYNWYRVFHYKDYSIVIKYETIKLQELLNTNTSEEINEIHLENLKNCHLRNFFNFRPKV